MPKHDPFSQENMNEIFKISPTDNDRITTRESTTIEFKESFGYASLPLYLKTCAAYANTKGGYIIFGIANQPHRLVGLTGSGLKSFESFDPEKMSSHFNDHFAPEISWDIHRYEFDGKIFGLIYINESTNKPVICTKDGGKDKELKEGDIYYRYRGRSQRIKYPELANILDARREIEQQLWMKHIESIAKIGVREVGIFDLHTGSVTGTGGSFLIDESLLSQLAFIKEGEFSEVRGAPALKLIGAVESFKGATAGPIGRAIPKGKGIRINDIILESLSQSNSIDGIEYIKQICYENTAFLPVYYYIRISKITLEKAIEILESVTSRNQSKKKLIERLKTRKTQMCQIADSKSEASRKKKDFMESIISSSVDTDLVDKDLLYFLQAVCGTPQQAIKDNSEYIRWLLRGLFNRYYSSASTTIADKMRRAICWIDEALNMDDVS